VLQSYQGFSARQLGEVIREERNMNSIGKGQSTGRLKRKGAINGTRLPGISEELESDTPAKNSRFWGVN